MGEKQCKRERGKNSERERTFRCENETVRVWNLTPGVSEITTFQEGSAPSSLYKCECLHVFSQSFLVFPKCHPWSRSVEPTHTDNDIHNLTISRFSGHISVTMWSLRQVQTKQIAEDEKSYPNSTCCPVENLCLHRQLYIYDFQKKQLMFLFLHYLFNCFLLNHKTLSHYNSVIYFIGLVII